MAAHARLHELADQPLAYGLVSEPAECLLVVGNLQASDQVQVAIQGQSPETRPTSRNGSRPRGPATCRMSTPSPGCWTRTSRPSVTAAVTLPFHNGRTEGVNTKTKMIKR